MAKHSKSIPPQLTYGFLGVVGVITLVLGFSNLGRVINNPAERAALERQKVFETVQSANTAAEQRLRTQDTDNDGLLDFDELNLYGTSPYLADSDSDGYGDKQEIESGNDPNCPSGTSCRSVTAAAGQSAVNDEGVSLNAFADILNYEQPAVAPAIDLTNLSATQIRELILQSGEMTAEQLSQIDDATIMQVYEQMLAEGAISAAPAQGDDVDLNNLDVAQIRELILQSGQMTQEQLNAIDDATIMQLYEQMKAESGGSL